MGENGIRAIIDPFPELMMCSIVSGLDRSIILLGLITLNRINNRSINRGKLGLRLIWINIGLIYLLLIHINPGPNLHRLLSPLLILVVFLGKILHFLLEMINGSSLMSVINDIVP